LKLSSAEAEIVALYSESLNTPIAPGALIQHNAGESRATRSYIPLQLSAYVAVNSETRARRLEKYFKTGSGKLILKKRNLQTEA